MAIASEKISTLLDDQIPDFIKSDHPAFVSFVKAYYEWLEDSTEGAVTYETKKLLDYSDVDTTTAEFLEYFKTKFLPYFPEEILSDKAKLIKNIREFYQKKGSEESLKFLFRVLYQQDIDVLYPKENILKASDGKWKLPQALRLTTSNTSASFDISSLAKRKAFGTTSRASCIIEAAYRTIDAGINREIFEIYVSNVNRLFENGENLEISYVDANGNNVILVSEKIIGSLSNIKINPNSRGLKYKTNDPVVIIGGLSETDPEIQQAVAVVNNVTTGQIQSIDVLAGGYGFRQHANTIVDISRANGDITGTGARAEVTAVDGDNAVSVAVNTDSIDTYASLALNTAAYAMANYAAANINSNLAYSFDYDTISVAPLRTITVTNSGGGYTETPNVTISSYYNSDWSNDYYGLISTSSTAANNWANTRQSLIDLGWIAHVDVLNGGSGYDSGTDTIYIGGIGNGSNATFSFTNDANGAITAVTVTNKGEGYRNTAVSIATTGGSGAVLRAYRYGEGETIDVNVDDIGRIKDFRLISRGYGYINTPSISLRIKDITISTPGGTISQDDYVYQGPNVNAYTFYAVVDSFDAANSIVRVYNYAGTLNTSSNLSFDTFNVAVSNVVTYGNGKAKANAEFLNGLIKYNGFFLNTDGFLSADKRLQDAKKYHNFSYVVIAEKALSSYREALLDIIHPAGTKLLGYNQLLSRQDDAGIFRSNLHTSVTGSGTNVTAYASDTVGLAIVNGTTNTAIASANDLLVINSASSSRRQVKRITSVTNSNSSPTLELDFSTGSYTAVPNNVVLLTLESNTAFTGDGRIRTTNASNTLVISSNVDSLVNTLAVGDFIAFNVADYRTNLANSSQELGNTTNYVYQRSTISSTYYPAPDGTNTANKLQATAVSGTHYIGHAGNILLAGNTYTISIFAKADEISNVSIIHGYNSGGVKFDLLSGTVESITTSGNQWIDAKIEPEANGNNWYRLIATGTPASTTTPIVILGGQTESFTGTGTNGLKLWGWQVEQAANASTYTPTPNTAIVKSNVATAQTIFGNVISISGNTIVLDTNSFMITSNTSNALYLVYPTYTNVSYNLISTAG